MNIDTGRYEGHTPGPWKLAEGDPYDEACWMDIVSENGHGFAIQECVGFSDTKPGPDVCLMVDAPLLLAEVQRLIAEVRRLRTSVGKQRNEGESRRVPTRVSKDEIMRVKRERMNDG